MPTALAVSDAQTPSNPNTFDDDDDDAEEGEEGAEESNAKGQEGAAQDDAADPLAHDDQEGASASGAGASSEGIDIADGALYGRTLKLSAEWAAKVQEASSTLRLRSIPDVAPELPQIARGLGDSLKAAFDKIGARIPDVQH